MYSDKFLNPVHLLCELKKQLFCCKQHNGHFLCDGKCGEKLSFVMLEMIMFTICKFIQVKI